MLDWNELSIDPVIRKFSDVLRVEFGLCSGFLDISGEFRLLSGQATPGERPLLEQILLDLEGVSCPLSTTIQEVGRLWAQKASESLAQANSHKGVWLPGVLGYSALLLAVRANSGELTGFLVVTGFFRAEQDDGNLGAIIGQIPEFLQARYAAYDDLALTRLDSQQRAGIQAWAYAMAEHASEIATVRINGDNEQTISIGGMVGRSEPMQKLFRTIGKVARSNATVLIEAENGTGKELVARAVHDLSRRKDENFIAVNCAAIPEELIASELFGHCKGAFSGAHRDRTGLFEAAHGGTLFLDEIGDMDITLQVKLLRVLQEGTFSPVGSNEVRRADVRVICATNKDLKGLVEQGLFREDLYYRIKVVSVSIPPLRERGGDIALLAQHFLYSAANRHGLEKKEFTKECLDAFMRHSWPGNVRELENEVERLVIMSGQECVIEPTMLSDRIIKSAESNEFSLPAILNTNLPAAIEMIERKMILDSLKRNRWNKSHAAKELGVSRRNLIRKVANYELEKS